MADVQIDDTSHLEKTAISPLDKVPIKDAATGEFRWATAKNLVPQGTDASKLFNPYKFSAYASADQTGIVSSTWSTVALQGENFDTGNNFSGVSSAFTAPIAGFYHFSAQAKTTSLGGLYNGMGLRFFKNSSIAITGDPAEYDNGVSYDFMSKHTSALIQLAAGDTIVLQVYLFLSSGNGGVTGSASVQNTYMHGFLVSAT